MDHRIPKRRRRDQRRPRDRARWSPSSSSTTASRARRPDRGARRPVRADRDVRGHKTLPTKQPVLFKGVEVGGSTRSTWDRRASRSAIVTFTLDDDFELHADAVGADRRAQPARRSLPRRRHARLDGPSRARATATRSRTQPSVNFDEALDFLDERRARQRRVADRRRSRAATGAAATASGSTARVGGLARTVSRARTS